MANIIIPPGWRIHDREATDRGGYTNRRQFMKNTGMAIAGLAVAPGCMARSKPSIVPAGPLDTIPDDAPRAGLPAARNARYTVPERPLTDRVTASSYNNFYEFISTGDLKNVWPLVGDYDPFPETIKVRGMVEEDLDLNLSELIEEMDLEERLYRFRCVEAWSMTIPWTGFPLAKLIEKCRPTSRATHVAFISANKPQEMPGIVNAPWYDWPYFEGLRLDEAMNELAFVATGMYGEPLPKQNGSPIRLVLPWKYGYKGPKAVVELRFGDREPATFWNKLQPAEYGFLSNVNPFLPHPRWTQASERFIRSESDIERRQTGLFNGYAEFVGDLYPDEPKTLTRGVVR
ncbi:MAG: protein-methionine-sulfoxide reductase catalytic subunit MsrP [Rhodothermales bacterium]|nr:protein-methionine-sulfoxide reductase catalytic subunit MsrP [Rhodothermales bacterium]MBO6780868.1 protein-methionine-sulfoxide reductase catalytic subunit MsrP [Rhodothermales bacterium]